MDRLDSAGFVELLTVGHAWFRRHVESVNALNVFPVPDGDTGTNMELSLASGVKAMLKAREGTLFDVVGALNKGLLMGARGNSGVILSQLFRGFLRIHQPVDLLDVPTFATAWNEGVQIAYKAVSKPVEGTILTVARESASIGLKEARSVATFAEWIGIVLESAEQSLARTPSLLPVLKEAGVVDSGGQGLVYIYEGFSRYFMGMSLEGESDVEKERMFSVGASARDLVTPVSHDTKGEFGYCTEVLIRLQRQKALTAEQTLKSRLMTYGNSLLVVAVEDLLKVHVHTMNPGRVLEDAIQYGSLVQVKVENMTEQHEALHNANAASVKTDQSAPEVAVVAVADGKGIRSVFQSLGVHRVVEGGNTMNPSTEDIAVAIEETKAKSVIVLPNHKNVILSAEQAKSVVSTDVRVLATENVLEGIAALVAYHPDRTLEENLSEMEKAVKTVVCGQVAKAVRETVFQNRDIVAGQYLGLHGSKLVVVGDDRDDVAFDVIRSIMPNDAELLTLFYGSNVNGQEAEHFAKRVEEQFQLVVEVTDGGQPIYDYVFSME